MLICVPIIAGNTREALKKIAEAQLQADIMELRLDLMRSFDLEILLRSAIKPVIVTFRSEKEGGMGRADYSVVESYLIRAAEKGASYIDVELGMPHEYRDRILKNRGNARAIISTHLIDSTPDYEELDRIYRESRGTGADVVKIVATARNWEDNFRILEIVKKAREDEAGIIAFCMGKMGRMSRIFSILMGGFLTFASLGTDQESAPGQMPVDEMRAMIEYFSRS